MSAIELITPVEPKEITKSNLSSKNVEALRNLKDKILKETKIKI